MSKNKLKIRLNSNYINILENAAKDIIKLSQKAGCKVSGPIPLPKSIWKITVNKSPHIDSKSKEQFEIRDLSRLIIIHYTAPELINDLRNFQLPPGVSFKILPDRKANKVSKSR